MFRTPRTITALLLLTLVAYVQSDDSTDRILMKVFKHFVEELQSLETANEEGTFSLEENNNGKTGLENLAGDDDNETDDKVTASSENDDSRTSPDVDEDSSDDTSDMEESVDYEEDHPIKTLAENLFDPSVNDLLDLAKEMGRIPETGWVSDLRMAFPRKHKKHKKHKRHRRHSRRHRRHHKKHRNRNHNRHEEHGECSTIGTDEYQCNNGEESVTVSYDESLSEYKMTLKVEGTEKLEGSAQIDKKICGEDSYCIEVAEVGGEKCVKMTSPEDKVIGCFTGGSSGMKKIESDTLIFEKHGYRH